MKHRLRAVEIAVTALGMAFVAAAAAASQHWLDSHFLPSFFVPRRWYVPIESVVRGTFAAVGVSLLFWRSRLARGLTLAPLLRVVAAACLAFVASDVALRWMHLRPTEWLLADEEPRRRADPQLGWVLVPDRVGRSRVSGRTVDYAIDRAGYRVRRVEEPVDPDRPTLVFGGESVMFGEGLSWDESIPAQAGAILGVQSANLAVHGYSTDQMYLRLERELPQFRRPVAVVPIFMTELFGRNLDADRPHVATGLVWQPPRSGLALMSLAGMVVPFRRSATVERGLNVTRQVFRAIVGLARARGASTLVVVPEFGPEDEAQRALRERAVPEDVPCLVVPLDPDWRLRWDRHPNARAARIIGAAIASRLAPMHD